MKTVPPEDAVASFDSASAFLTSLARALQQWGFPYLGQSRLKVPLVRGSALLPERLRRRAYAIASGREGVRPERLGAIDLEQVAPWVTTRYAPGRSEAVLIGSSDGALTPPAAAWGGPRPAPTARVPLR